MTNKIVNLIQAVLALPAIKRGDISTRVPHLVVDWHSQRNINDAACSANIATFITTKFEPRNKGRKRAQMTYHVFRITGNRKINKLKGTKRPFISRPRPTIDIPVVIQIPKPYRRHCGGH